MIYFLTKCDLVLGEHNHFVICLKFQIKWSSHILIFPPEIVDFPFHTATEFLNLTKSKPGCFYKLRTKAKKSKANGFSF